MHAAGCNALPEEASIAKTDSVAAVQRWASFCNAFQGSAAAAVAGHALQPITSIMVRIMDWG